MAGRRGDRVKDKSKAFVLWFDELGIEDVGLVGGKNASLGEMYRNLTRKGVRIPNGFAVTAYAYRYVLEKAGVAREIREALKGLDVKDIEDLAERGAKVRHIIRRCEFPPELEREIIAAYRKLSREYGAAETDVAVRSSATAEDLPDASFAGQQETFLNVRGAHHVIDAIRDCMASLFTNRAIAYRVEKGFDHFKVALSAGVQKMVRSDLASSGVMFTLDTESGFRDVVLINGSWGLGENIVQGAVNPDEWYVFKPTLRTGHKAIIQRTLGEKSMRMVYTLDSSRPTRNVPVPAEERRKFCLTDDEVLTLAKWGVIVEDHYTRKRGKPMPMDLEWAKDGRLGQLFIVQARPETVQSQKSRTILEEYRLKEHGKVLTTGRSVGEKIGQGPANVIKSVHDVAKFKEGEVLVTEMTDPDWVVAMKRARAIVTNRGGRTCFTGDTKILTNWGFRTMQELFEEWEGLKVPSLNRETLKIEWKPIEAVMKRRAPVIEVATSLTGRQGSNTLRLTPNHKMIALENRKLVDKEIAEVLRQGACLLLAQRLPSTAETTRRQLDLAYVLGALSTDGHVRLTPRRGEITFVQKPTPEKEAFISSVIERMQSAFGKKPKAREKPLSQGMIRGKPVRGSANSYRWHSKQIAEELTFEQRRLVPTLLESDEVLAYHFLAGVIDGDGTYNKGAHRINIYCSKPWLKEAVVVACLRIGIVPQVSRNRGIANIQVVERLEELSRYTRRVKATGSRKRIGTRFFAARELLGDVERDVNAGGRILTYIQKNLLIGADELSRTVVPRAPAGARQELERLITGDISQQRVGFVRDLGERDVYNITVADNHNYIVFTDAYTPILTNNCHAAIVSRELGIPCIVGTNNATERVKTGQKVTVSCSEGEEGRVYEGLLKYDVKRIDLSRIPKPKTKVMMNVGNPEEAFELSFTPNDGVGLAREEFIITSYIKVHPRALLEYRKLPPHVKAEVDKLTAGYDDKAQFFVDKLAQGIAMIGAAFYPKDVIVRLSDFKSNEYAGLIGGEQFEPKEENPMIGWRGASRYYKAGYRDAFALECRAFRKVRDEMGLTNVKVMVPFCRTPEEGRKVLQVMRENGLVQGRNGLQVYVMCEIPSNVLLADAFSDVFDGFSIGTNDLTQLTLGLDRDSALVADIYDERNPAVEKLVAEVIRVAKRRKRKIGICGDAPSTYPEFAQFLVREGIDSISLSPDAVMKTLVSIVAMEKKLKR
jgi:pyruvate,water dikinase